MAQISDDNDIMGLVDQLKKHQLVDIYVEFQGVKRDKNIPQALLSNSRIDVGIDVSMVDEFDSGNDWVSMIQVRMLDVPINYQSDANEEREEARIKVSKYVQLKKKILTREGERDEGHNKDKGEGAPIENIECLAGNQRPLPKVKDEKVVGFESDYFEL